MIDLNLSTLALGGLAATIGVFWQQAKTVFNYLSSFVIISATLDYQSSAIMRRYLKGSGRWIRLPGGDLRYESIRSNIDGRPANDTRVPLRHKLGSSNIMFRRWGFIMVSASHRISIRGIRGLLNVDALLSEAYDWSAYEDNGVAATARSRYAIYNHVGTEKGAWATEPRSKRGHGGESDSAEPVDDSPIPVDSDLDVSFKYDRNLWNKNAADENPFEFLFYPQAVLHHLEVLRMWLAKGDWYKDRGIPWRRGLLLQGPAGTGKSSLTRAIAQTLGLPLHVFHLSTLSDQEMIENWQGLSGSCVVLFEDFDTVFDKRQSLTSHGALTFECILNLLSGVGTNSGVILIVTTNHPEKIDDALINRPGRIDAVITVGTMEEQQRRGMAERMLRDWPDMIDEMVAKGDGMAGAQFQDACVQAAFVRMAEDEAKVVPITHGRKLTLEEMLLIREQEEEMQRQYESEFGPDA